jgi:hypothetical protein
MKNITKVIYCLKKDINGVNEKIGVINETLNEKGKKTYSTIKKEDFIKDVKQLESNGFVVNIIKEDGIKIHIVNNKYLRTDGDKYKHNDLLEIKEC